MKELYYSGTLLLFLHKIVIGLSSKPVKNLNVLSFVVIAFYLPSHLLYKYKPSAPVK
jgi:hypothetical protein